MELLLFLIVIFLIGFVLWGFGVLSEDEIDIFDNIEYHFRYGGYNPICAKFQKAKEEGDFFRQILCFKKLLKNEDRVKCLVDYASEYYYHGCPDGIFWKIKRDAAEIWRLSEHRQLFSPEELEIIDKSSRKIDSARKHYQMVCKAQEEHEKTLIKIKATQKSTEVEDENTTVV